MNGGSRDAISCAEVASQTELVYYTRGAANSLQLTMLVKIKFQYEAVFAVRGAIGVHRIRMGSGELFRGERATHVAFLKFDDVGLQNSTASAIMLLAISNSPL
jgi:hypothetical protein